MPTTRTDIERWLRRAQDEGATHMIVACDWFDMSDYPINLPPGEDPHERVEKVRDAGDRVMEVYSLTGSHTLEEQLGEFRAFHYD